MDVDSPEVEVAMSATANGDVVEEYKKLFHSIKWDWQNRGNSETGFYPIEINGIRMFLTYEGALRSDNRVYLEGHLPTDDVDRTIVEHTTAGALAIEDNKLVQYQFGEQTKYWRLTVSDVEVFYLGYYGYQHTFLAGNSLLVFHSYVSNSHYFGEDVTIGLVTNQVAKVLGVTAFSGDMGPRLILLLDTGDIVIPDYGYQEPEYNLYSLEDVIDWITPSPSSLIRDAKYALPY